MLRQQITLAHSCATKNGFNRKKSHANRSKTHAVKVEEIALKETKRQESNPLKEIVIKKRQIKQKNDIGKEESIENVFFNKLAKFQCKGGSIECSTREFMNSKDDDDIFVEVIMEIKDIAKTDERFSLHWATKSHTFFKTDMDGS